MKTKSQAKNTIEKLVEKFDSHYTEYKKSSYQETSTRVDFINPFFEALGWDITDKLGLGVVMRDVIHEDKLKIDGVTKAPDYCFTINGTRKFFLEAKRPGINIKDQIDPAYQVRRYGWNAKLPISVLTDFEEFAVYDCSVKPLPSDRAVISRIKYFTYKDYISEFDFLWDTLSKESIIDGSLDKYAITNKSKKGTEGVDVAFLKSLDNWRDVLARNLVLKNVNLNEDELNYSIQKIIDRIIFLRICEDRGIEPELQLFNSIGTNTYGKLMNLFNIADQKYNSGLFDFRKDVITDKLNVDDKALKTIIEEMYYPKSPYEFSVIPVEILGHSYEQYLGKVIKIDSKHKISIEEKPEVRKAGGVYYTPQYIVDYIVKNTVGKIIDGKTPDEITKIKIVDPACGSGSFLLGAYKFLLEWHLQYYQNAKLKNKAQYLTNDGKLTNEIKKKILINNIFGVDIDTNAVEVTKLSLMLQVMEGETSVSIEHQSQLIQDRVLPSLDKNILSGNSLIDFDFYDNQIDFEPGAEKKIKPFNWQNSFPEVFKDKIIDEDLKAFHITWATHNSRVNERMFAYESVIEFRRAKRNEPVIKAPRLLDLEEEVFLTNCIKEISNQYNYRILGFNICRDHVHLALVCKEEEIPAIVRTIKSISSRKLNEFNGMTITKHSGINNGNNIGVSSNASIKKDDDAEAFGLAQMLTENERGSTQTHLWQSKYSSSIIKSDEEMYNVLTYIKNNRIKHELPENQQIITIVNSFIISPANAFKPKIVKGGFDVVIGNPPYVRIHEIEEVQKIYLKWKFKTAQNQFDLYQLFYELSLKIINNNGLIGFITSNKFCITNYGLELRKLLFYRSNIEQIVDCSKTSVFGKVSTYPYIFILGNGEPNPNVALFENFGINFELQNTFNQNNLLFGSELTFSFNNNSVLKDLLLKIDKKGHTNVLDVYRGRGTSKDIINDTGVKTLTNKQIRRYEFDDFLIYKNGKYGVDNSEKIMMKKVCYNLECSLDEVGTINPINTVYVVKSQIESLSIKYILGILNSKLLSFYARNKYSSTSMRGGYIELRVFEVSNLPIPQNPEPEIQKQLIKLVDTMLQLNKDLQNTTLPEQKEQLQARIKYTDNKIDQLVYQLYELTEDEIKIVEGE